MTSSDLMFGIAFIGFAVTGVWFRAAYREWRKDVAAKRPRRTLRRQDTCGA